MGKTITGIIETAVGIALEFTPLAPIGTSLILTGLATTVQGLIGTPKPAATATSIKSSQPPRISAYGRSRLFGAYLLYETSSAGVACDVYAIHDGQIDGPEFFYLGDIDVARTHGVLGGTSDGAYSAGSVEIDYRAGLPTETAFSQVTNLIPSWNASHRGDGVATAMVTWQPVKSKDYLKVYPNGQPALSVAARWARVFDWRDTTQVQTDATTWKWSENFILHLADYLLRFDNKTWATHFAPTLSYWSAAANDADVQMPILGFGSITTADDSVDSDHTIVVADPRGLYAGMTVVIVANDNTGNTDTRTVQSIAGPVITLSSEVTNFYPKGSSVTWQSTTAHPMFEARYRSCVAFKHTDAHKDVIGNLLACGDGFLSPRADGALVVFSGRYTTPTVTIGPDEVVSYSLQDGVDEENAINSISVGYVSANHTYNTVDTDPWTDEDDIAFRGKILASSISPQTPSFSQNRRLAKRTMAKIMAPKRGTVSTNSAGRIARGERYIMLDLTDAGTTFFAGPVEITKLTRNLQTGGVTFDWIAADPNIDEWNPATEEGLPAPVGNRVAAEPVDAPTITSATANFSADSGSGSTGAYIVLTVTGGGSGTDLTWYVRTREVGAAVWGERTYTDIPAGDPATINSEFVPTGAMVEVEAAYEAGNGIVSPWSATVQVNSTTPASTTTYDGGNASGTGS